MDFKSILLAQKTGYIPRNHFDALFAKRIGGAVLKDFPGLPSSIVTVTDALAKPLDSLKVAINPVQSGSGDPSPDNIRPISGWTGANITVDPSVTPILSVLESAVYYSQYFNISTFTAKPNSEYYIRSNAPYLIKKKLSTFIVCAYEDEPSTVAYGVFGTELRITTKTSGKISVYWRCDSGGDPITITNVDDFKDGTYYLQITDHPTDGYTGQDYPITFPSEAGTVYGGTLDVTNGTLTVDRKVIALNDIKWIYAQPHFECSISGAVGYNGNNLCSCYKKSSINNISSAQDDLSFIVRSNIIAVRDNSFNNDVDAFKNAMTGQILVYELATPITYQLTPTEVQMLLGTNNIWADTGDILEGKYWGKKSSSTRAMLNTLRDAGEITRITPEEPEETEEEEPEESDER